MAYFGQFCWSGTGGSLTGTVLSTVTAEVLALSPDFLAALFAKEVAKLLAMTLVDAFVQAPLRILLCNSQDTSAIRFR